MKNLFKFLVIFIIIFSLCLSGCGNVQGNDSGKSDEEITEEGIFQKEYNNWLLSENSQDLDKNNKIDENDYKIWKNFINWKISDYTYDFNNDEKITFEDYTFYLIIINTKYGLNEKTFYSSNKIVDYMKYINKCYDLDYNKILDVNEDGKTNYKDYILCYNTYEDWACSEISKDIDGNKKINKDDYNIWKNYLKWKISDYVFDYSISNVNFVHYIAFASIIKIYFDTDVECFEEINLDDFNDFIEENNMKDNLNVSVDFDINKDGQTTYADYVYLRDFLNIVGKYKIKNIEYTGSSFYLLFFNMKDFDNYKDNFYFEINKNGTISPVFDEVILEKLDNGLEGSKHENGIEDINDFFEIAKINSITQNSFKVTSLYKYVDDNFNYHYSPCEIIFEKNGNEFTSEFEFEIFDKKASFAITLEYFI